MDKTKMSKTQKLNYFKNLRDRIGPCESVKTKYPVKYNKFINLFREHPRTSEKMSGMIDLKIEHDPRWNRKNLSGRGYQLSIVKSDGSTETIGLPKCIRGPPSTEAQFKKAMRHSVDDDILNYKFSEFSAKGTWGNCPGCGKGFTETTTQIDHIDPFSLLLENFLKEHPDPKPQEFDKDPIKKTPKFKPENREYENKWVLYHRDHATLRFLCGVCNREKSNKI